MKLLLPKRPRRNVMHAFIGGPFVLAIAREHLGFASPNERDAKRLLRTWRWDLARASWAKGRAG